MRLSNILLLVVFSLYLNGPAYGSERYPPPPLQPKPAPVHQLGDPLLSQAWHLGAMRTFDAWRITQGHPSTVIAFIDSGLNYNHPEISPNLHWKRAEWPFNGSDDDRNGFVDDLIGWDFVKNHALPWDRGGHGTFLAVLAAGVEGNGIGAAGVCPKCSVLPVRFLNYEGLGDTEDAIAGLRSAIREKVSIVNFSFSGEGIDYDLKRAIIEADAADILVVVAASNDGLNGDYEATYPAKFLLPNMITVAALVPGGDLWQGSNWGKRTVQIGAPGQNLLSWWINKWDTGDGTSDAAALVSGAAGLIRSAAPQLTARAVKQIIMATARPVPSLQSKITSGGMIDIAAALECATNGLYCLRGQSHQRP